MVLHSSHVCVGSQLGTLVACLQAAFRGTLAPSAQEKFCASAGRTLLLTLEPLAPLWGVDQF